MRILLIVLLASCAGSYRPDVCEPVCDRWAQIVHAPLPVSLKDRRTDVCTCYSPIQPWEPRNYYNRREVMVRLNPEGGGL